MKLIDKTKAVLLDLREEMNARALECDKGTEARVSRLADGAAIHEAILLIDLVQDWASGEGHQPAKRDRLVNFLKKETMK